VVCCADINANIQTLVRGLNEGATCSESVAYFSVVENLEMNAVNQNWASALVVHSILKYCEVKLH
jgi:hypothetical protein